MVNHQRSEITSLQEIADGMPHLYSRLKRLANGHPCSKLFFRAFTAFTFSIPAQVHLRNY